MTLILKIGSKIKHMLKVRGMTQSELARKSGASLSIIKALANDRKTTTTTDTLEKIAGALEIPPSYFFADNSPQSSEAALYIPEEIKDLIIDTDKLDYLMLAKKMSDMNLPIEVAEKLLDTYSTIIKSSKDNH